MIFLPGTVASSIQTLGISGDFEVFRTSIYGLSSTVSNWLTLSGFGTTPSSAVWQVYLPNNSEFLNTQQTDFAYGYLSGGGNPSIDASLVPLSARLLVSVLGGTYFSKNVVPLKPYETPLDIPNLQLWLDASDENTIQKNVFFEDESWYFNEDSRIECQNSGFSFGTNPFTVECWICPTGISSDGRGTILMMSSFIFLYDSSGRIEKFADITSPANTITFNTWQHVAFVREGTGSNQAKIYVNGNQVAQGTMNSNVISTSVPTIGMNNNGIFNGVIGYISNFRVVNGEALYTSNFNHLISAAVPLQNITGTGVNTSVLTLQDNIIRDNSFNNLVLSNNGPLAAVVKLSSDLVVRDWVDKSPNALTASQLLGPTSLSAEINNLNVLNFDGADEFLTLSQPIALSSDFTHFFVYRREGTNTISQSLGNRSPGVQSSFRHHSDNRIYSGAERSNSTILSTGTLIGGVRKNEYLQIDSTSIPFTTNWSSIQTTVNTIGVYNNVDYHRGPIGEIIHTGAMLPNQEVDLVNRKLYDKWKVPKIPPYNKVPQTIFATSISALSTTLGTWAVEPTGFNIQWQKSLDDSIYTNIPLATSTVYNPTTSDFEAFIRSSISASNVAGISLPSFSNVLQLTTQNIIPATITRTTIFTVSATPGTWESTLPIQKYYQWQINTNTGNGWENFGTLSTQTSAYLSAYELNAVDVRVLEQAYNSTLEL